MESGEHAPEDTADGVGRIEPGDHPRGPAPRPQGPHGDRERRSQRERRQQDQEADREPEERTCKRAGRGDGARQGEAGKRREELESGAGAERIGRCRDQPGDEEGADPEAGHERGEDDGDRARGSPHLETEKLEPDHLVDEGRGTTGQKQRQEERGGFHQMAGTGPRCVSEPDRSSRLPRAPKLSPPPPAARGRRLGLWHPGFLLVTHPAGER